MNYVRELYQMPGEPRCDYAAPLACWVLHSIASKMRRRAWQCALAAGIKEAINIYHIKTHYYTSHQRLVRSLQKDKNSLLQCGSGLCTSSMHQQEIWQSTVMLTSGLSLCRIISPWSLWVRVHGGRSRMTAMRNFPRSEWASMLYHWCG